MSKENKGNEKQYYYHGTKHNIKDHINPTHYHHLNENLIFLTNNLPMAHGYTISNEGRMKNSYVKDGNYCLVVNYEKIDYQGGYIYQYPQESYPFKKLNNNTESTYDKKLSVDKNNTIIVNDLKDVMKGGVQIFIVNQLPSNMSTEYSAKHNLEKSYALALTIFNDLSIRHTYYYQTLGELVKLGCITYLNGQEKENPILLNALGIELDDCKLKNIDKNEALIKIKDTLEKVYKENNNLSGLNQIQNLKNENKEIDEKQEESKKNRKIPSPSLQEIKKGEKIIGTRTLQGSWEIS